MTDKAKTILETGATLGTISFSIANINALLTTVLLVCNISYLLWKWNKKRKAMK